MSCKKSLTECINVNQRGTREEQQTREAEEHRAECVLVLEAFWHALLRSSGSNTHSRIPNMIRPLGTHLGKLG
ncbi:Uncharacterized protein DAT39_005765 [Clarias magur]|uniref:Uncharacterized protein n=1 Tax=Clarias magur TaxID=1594786 RepID=A0A8J4UAT9_CLAMG|nr:Uncharacterized protein DAT39_005765 [Clarias magur]